MFDAAILARIQFAFTVSFHIIFPAFTIGLSAFITVLLGRWIISGNDKFKILARFWTKIFAVSFAMGVVSGIVLSYQFGLNWSRFSVVTGNVIGALIGYEVLTAFFLEATFLGVLLFGWNRVRPGMLFFAALMVAVGTAMSSFWILSANSWMQVPTGYELRDGIAFPVDWWAIIFNPTFLPRLFHMVVAAYLTTALVVLAVGARYLLAQKHIDLAFIMVRMGLGMVLILAPAQAIIGDIHGLNTAQHQPVKLAAMEGHWPADEVAPLVLFAWPDAKTETNLYEVSIPRLGSFIITHDWNGKYKGLKAFAPEERPPVAPLFFSFRAMVGLGLLFILVAFWGAYLWIRGKLFYTDSFLKVASLMWPLGFVALLIGWYLTEIGRQPWIVTGILKTADAISPVPAQSVAISLGLFIVVYGFVFTFGLRYINKLINKGPDNLPIPTIEGVANRPLGGASDITIHHH